MASNFLWGQLLGKPREGRQYGSLNATVSRTGPARPSGLGSAYITHIPYGCKLRPWARFAGLPTEGDLLGSSM